MKKTLLILMLGLVVASCADYAFGPPIGDFNSAGGGGFSGSRTGY